MAHLTRLDSLQLDGNQIDDLTPLAALTQLTSLRRWKNQITDLTPLAGLTKLTVLWVTRASLSAEALLW